MLVLSRKHQESFQIGLIRVIVVGIEAGRVKLGIEAPADMRIERVDSLQKVDEIRNGEVTL